MQDSQVTESVFAGAESGTGDRIRTSADAGREGKSASQIPPKLTPQIACNSSKAPQDNPDSRAALQTARQPPNRGCIQQQQQQDSRESGSQSDDGESLPADEDLQLRAHFPSDHSESGIDEVS